MGIRPKSDSKDHKRTHFKLGNANIDTQIIYVAGERLLDAIRQYIFGPVKRFQVLSWAGYSLFA